MPLPAHKTKIVATIGPASREPATLEALIRAGLNVARLNFSHGDLPTHAENIARLRVAAKAVGTEVTLMADLPGPKMRIGQIDPDPMELVAGNEYSLRPGEDTGDENGACVSFDPLPRVVRPGDNLFLNDGLIQLRAVRIEEGVVHCQVVVGGELRSRKGLNLPGIDLGMSAFTEEDRECLRFALEHGVDAVSQSFVATAKDVQAVREAAKEMGHTPFIIAKIKRAGALQRLDEILAAADGIMIARGDLGVEVPIERIAILQKQIMREAVRAGKPVITATQMLESMTQSRQPTRAEATDVANAILDGTDCVMLSAESAIGRFPVEAVKTLGRIAAATEPHRNRREARELMTRTRKGRPCAMPDLISMSVERVLDSAEAAAVIVPTRSGTTARRLARFRLPVWVAAASPDAHTCAGLRFSYGVIPIRVPEALSSWDVAGREWIQQNKLPGEIALLVQGPSQLHPNRNHTLELIRLSTEPDPDGADGFG
jgi:pyruvate kinase